MNNPGCRPPRGRSEAQPGRGVVGNGSPVVPKGSPGMGGKIPSPLVVAPAPLLILVLLLGVCAQTVFSCKADVCWKSYQVAKVEYEGSRKGKDRSGSRDSCVPLRTYMQCLEGLHGCKGNINYHSIKKMIRNQMNQQDCEVVGPTFMPRGTVIHIPPPDSVCTFQGAKVYRHCGLFGDPHLRTFSNEFQTCKVQGAWPLIDNDHLIVQVTNEPVSNSIGATATTKLTVLIKRNSECAANKYLIYQAQTGFLPGTFDDGQTAYGLSHSVELIEVDPGKHVEILVKYIDTKILVRQVGSYLTFAISIPEELINTTRSGLELCVHGCPQSEIINYQKFLGSRQKEINSADIVMSRQEAESVCRKEGLVDFYLDSCVFDLMTTGSENFTAAAFSALQDLLRLAPEVGKQQENRTSVHKYDLMFNSANSLRTTWSNCLRILILTLFSCFLCKLEVS